MFTPLYQRDYFRPFKAGDKGWPVAAYQLNLGRALGEALAVDGEFGPKTVAATLRYQARHGIDQVGYCGPRTAKSICLVLAAPAQIKYRTPKGLARGVLEGESGYDLACVSAVYSNGTRDIGAWQDNLSSSGWGSDATLRRSFSAWILADETLKKFRDRHDVYVSWGCSNEVAWKCATLYHNRPADADTLARARGDWDSLSDAPGWFTIGGVSYSKQDWCRKYVYDKTRYVTNWTP